MILLRFKYWVTRYPGHPSFKSTGHTNRPLGFWDLENFKKCLCLFQTQNKIHIMKSVLYGAHIIGDMMFKGSNFYLLGNIPISFVLIWYIASASFEVCSMLSWFRLQWNWCWRFARCSADLAANGTDAGGSTKQMLSIHQRSKLKERKS